MEAPGRVPGVCLADRGGSFHPSSTWPHWPLRVSEPQFPLCELQSHEGEDRINEQTLWIFSEGFFFPFS